MGKSVTTGHPHHWPPFQEEALEIPLVQERFSLASLIANPEDRVALRTLLAFHSNGVENAPERNAKAYKSLRDCGLSGSTLLEAIARGNVKPKGLGRSHLVARAAQVYEFLQNCSKDHEEAIGSLFDPSLASKIGDEGKRRKATRDLTHLRDSALLLVRESKEGADLKSILEKLRYRIATRIPLTEAESARVRIMTLHGAKGLEADVVIVAGTADEIIPGYLSEEPREAEKEREERRRLLYVSVTRAKRQLIISWPLTMPYKDAVENQVRTDGGVITKKNGDKFVKLGKTQLLPDISQTPETGKIWLKSALSKS